MQARTLPERPDLDHLKHEAKALLKVLRGRDPAAKLTDAQRQLAREYGFPTWAKLRARVTAMRTTAGDAIAAFLSAVQDQNRDGALEVLGRFPALPASSLHVAASLGSAPDVARLARGKAVRAKAGTPPADPLLFLCFSPFHGESAERDAGLLESARLLLAAGADPNTKDASNSVPALYAVTGRHHVPAIARLLLEAGANPTDGESVFHAAERFHEEALELLWEFGVKLNHVGEWGNTPLYFLLRWYDAATNESVAKGIEWLLAHGADPNIPSGKEREDALQVAVRRGQSADVLRRLLGHGADVTARRGDGTTAWLLAKRGGYDEIVRILEEAGASAQPLSPVDEMLAACGRGDVAAARRLSSPTLVAELTESERAMLGEAAAAGRARVVDACIAAGFDVNALDENGATPLHVAAISGHVDVVRALLRAGARHDIRDPEHNSTAMGWATFGADFVADPGGQYEATVRALLDGGATVRPDEHPPQHEGVRRVLMAGR